MYFCVWELKNGVEMFDVYWAPELLYLYPTSEPVGNLFDENDDDKTAAIDEKGTLHELCGASI